MFHRVGKYSRLRSSTYHHGTCREGSGDGERGALTYLILEKIQNGGLFLMGPVPHLRCTPSTSHIFRGR